MEKLSVKAQAAKALEGIRNLDTERLLCVSINPGRPDIWCRTCKVRYAEIMEVKGTVQ